MSAHTIISLYGSTVLPVITYGYVVWSPDTQTAFDKLEAIQHRLLRYCSLKTDHPLSFYDHDFTPLLNEFRVPTIRSLFKYYDLITAFKIIREIMECWELRSLFSQREVYYDIRLTTDYDYSFNTPIARLHRAWNQLPGSTQDIRETGAFKNVIRSNT